MTSTRPRSRYRAVGAAVLATILAIVLVAGCSSGAANGGKHLTTLRVAAPATAVAGLSPVLTGPAGWAIERGTGKAILAKYGYQYGGLAAFSNGPPAAQALASGSVQLAQIGDAPAVLSRGAGQPTRAILIANTPGQAWIVARDDGPASLAELKGKKVGVQFGSDFDHYLRVALDKAGLTGKVTLINMVMADGYAALRSGSIDAYSAIAGIAAVWQSKGGVRVIQKAREADPQYQDSNITLTTESFLKAHPNVQQAWWSVYRAGLELIKKDPEAYYAWTAKESGETPAIAKETTYVGDQDAPVTTASIAAASATRDFLVAQKLTKSFSVQAWAVHSPTSAGG